MLFLNKGGFFVSIKKKNYFINRPDFLHEIESMTPRLCEINARFPLNGYLLTQIGCSAVLESPALGANQHGLSRIQTLENVFENLKSMFDLKRPIGILKQKEVLLTHTYTSFNEFNCI